MHRPIVIMLSCDAMSDSKEDIGSDYSVSEVTHVMQWTSVLARAAHITYV